MEADNHLSQKPWFRRKAFVIPAIVIIVVLACLIAAVIAFVVTFDAQRATFAGSSMAPTINEGDGIIISRKVSSLQRGDIVAFYYPQDRSQRFIKRVIGLPGETIEMDEQGNIMINGAVLDEPYVAADRNENARSRWYRIKAEWKHLEPNYYFLMGDNRDASNDSRTWGPVSKTLIYGKVIGR